MAAKRKAPTVSSKGTKAIKTESEPLDPNKEKLRQAYSDKLVQCFRQNPQHVLEANATGDELQFLVDLANEICDCCYDAFSFSTRILKQRIAEIYNSLKSENSEYLRKRLLHGEMTIKELVDADVFNATLQETKKFEIIPTLHVPFHQSKQDADESHSVQDAPAIQGPSVTNSPSSNAQEPIKGPMSQTREFLIESLSQHDPNESKDAGIYRQRPDVSLYKRQCVQDRIKELIESLPENISKALLKPLEAGIRRIANLFTNKASQEAPGP
ncbi:Transcription elongation factor S-II [Babesia duncani]|uniref:Transcription elongation factor S-II n=1 Tax=Babesia duncani TaxID=323732 RepID=A0AAD9PMQ7_9APIC|nr:Transcription elongation factor S-II [Babesia duncani]